MSTDIPKTMKAVYLEEHGKPTIVKEIPVPELLENEILVKVEVSPVNPSDFMFLLGIYDIAKHAPTVPGFEGAGIVIDAKGETEKTLIGKKVAFYSIDQSSGAFGQYAKVNLQKCLPLPEDVSFEQGCGAYINPFTVLCMYRIVKNQNVKAVIHTAGASQVGRQMMRYFQSNGVTVIAVVRRQEQVDILEKLGGKYIVNTSDDKWEETLKQYATELDARIAFDAIAGEMTTKISAAQPKNSTTYVYGGLSGQPISGLGMGDIIFQNKFIAGFLLTRELESLEKEEAIEIAKKAPQLVNGDLKTDVSKVFSYEQFNEALEYYQNNMSAGKVLIKYQV